MRKTHCFLQNNDFFPILRMLLPQNERERGAYGIKENTLARMYIRVLNLPNKGREATKLTNYKAPSSSQATAADFADVAYYVLKSRCNNSGELTIQDVNDSLDKIASLHADRNQSMYYVIKDNNVTLHNLKIYQPLSSNISYKSTRGTRNFLCGY